MKEQRINPVITEIIMLITEGIGFPSALTLIKIRGTNPIAMLNSTYFEYELTN